jgi:hypothetical protein
MPFTPTRDRIDPEKISTPHRNAARIGSGCAPRPAKRMNGCKS